MEGPYLERFLSRIRPQENGCWEWDGAHISTGYAESWDGKRPLLAHRVAYEHWKCPIPPGLVVDHLCRNRGCVNPEHLEVVTEQTNILRGVSPSAHHAAKTECLNGHTFSEENTYIDPRGRRECRTCKIDRRRAAGVQERTGRSKPRSWSDEDLEHLDNEWPTSTAREIAGVLGRTESSVFAMAARRGLGR